MDENLNPSRTRREAGTFSPRIRESRTGSPEGVDPYAKDAKRRTDRFGNSYRERKDEKNHTPVQLEFAKPGFKNDTMADCLTYSYVIRRFNYGSNAKVP